MNKFLPTLLLFVFLSVSACGVELPAGTGHVDSSLFPAGLIDETQVKEEKKESFIIVNGRKCYARNFKPIKRK